MKYYVVADVHGYYTPMKKALKDAGFFEEKKPHKLIVCGDLLDRGNEAKQTIDFMMQLLKDDKLIYIRGNHEDLLIMCLQEIASGNIHEIASGMSNHYKNGTWHTLLQIAGMGELEAYNNPNELVRRVRNSSFYKKLLFEGVNYFETQNYIFTHGWIPCKVYGYNPRMEYKYNPNWRKANEIEWGKARWYNGMLAASKFRVLEPNKTIVCGHWNASYGHAVIEKKGTEKGSGAINTPFYGKGIIAIDACTAKSGFVNCIVLDD